ncbi:putative ABC transport system ATP-binding protein [Roseimicrobium gellanilyticum]|uniref:Putative ABC transport system ATP-binding protein n=1 Tax=Roseimicrobium gellanilyticum TaxID=748857 RepID=A0A366HP52_9BACT|nr:ABC transporter ATP-binding protein [Roseimicrobium gellanilyticum]RBP44566.1 putative ABC transport system ATP-binding protein [Roseimicrobium gellanilyticum]
MSDTPPNRGDHKIAVHAKGIVKSFGDGGSKLTVLKGVDFDARDGEIMMLVGPSGCGKTTLLSILAGTLRAEQGSIEVFGRQIDKLSNGVVTKFRAENIGFIFQSFNLIPTLNCAENVSVPLLIQGVSPRKAEAKAREVLAQVGLGERWKHRPNQLSGGQQQRVAIARALVHEPRLIICDEPTAALDAKNGALVMDLFEKIARVPGRCVIIVTHDNRIFSHADRIAQMDDGKIVEVHDVDRAEPPVFHH